MRMLSGVLRGVAAKWRSLTLFFIIALCYTLTSTGAYMIYPPAGFVTFGVMLWVDIHMEAYYARVANRTLSKRQ